MSIPHGEDAFPTVPTTTDPELPMKKTAQKSIETKKSSLFTIAAKDLKLIHGGAGVIINGPRR